MGVKEEDIFSELDHHRSSQEDVTVQAFLLLVCGVLMVIKFLQIVIHNVDLPPGPVGVPILGVLPLMGKKPYLCMQRWWEQYGDVYSCYMGSRLVVVINGVEAMRECFVKQSETFSHRPWNYFKKMTKNKGIVFTEGDVWKEHRRFTLSCLRDFGMGKVTMEQKIHEELEYLLREIANQDGKPFDPVRHVPKATSNIICSVIYGSRFDYEDRVFLNNIEALDQSIRYQSQLAFIQFLPFLEFLPKILPKDKLLQKNVQMRDFYAQLQLERHKSTMDMANPRDFIDAYLIKMNEMTAKGEYTSFEESQLSRTIQDLFIAGSETLNTTLKWALLLMVVHPDVQGTVQDEIDSVLGKSRAPTMKDRQFLPYTEAALLECQRVGNIAMFSVPRCTTSDTYVQGNFIPKGTWILVNRWGMHANPKYWPHPNMFDPSRFLDSEGKVHRPEAFVPFGIGPRSCLGESLAKMELFIFFTALLQKFKLRLPEGEPIPNLEPKVGINMSPSPYQICATMR